ncbi:hypothetical protein LOTGIDRAFT_153912 [Lottia gigantea]|uniref:Uncharacterized protein n=1 Tax=Lottia gigantea TaxID=225164 RepID=V3ZJL5_LOTGI|nr:hypothetical protein LOTGIDRAFT_153912 [Lottia gigantea]ESO91468.1 hypothetical protein LOTGIDRAFT_153912 [Lottia gigantea]
MYGLRRERPLTEKGKMMFDSKCSTQQRNCDTSWNRVEDLIISLHECNDVKSLRKLDYDINQACHTYCKSVKLYLKREGTAEASAALETFSPHFDKCLEVVNKCLTDLRNKKLELIETISQSGASVQSGTSSSKRAKAAVEQTKLEYVRQEGELLKQKAAIEANISIVKQKAVAAAANIEATYDEDKVEEPRIPVSDKMQDVQIFVDESRRFTLQSDSNQTFPLSMYAPVASANVNIPPNPVNAFDDMGELSSAPLPNLPVSSPVIIPPRNVNFSAPINQPTPPEYLPYGSQGNIPPTSLFTSFSSQ